jgi:hypothetical protein
MGESDDGVLAEVDPNHPLREPLLKRLLDHPTAFGEVRRALLEERVGGHQLRPGPSAAC